MTLVATPLWRANPKMLSGLHGFTPTIQLMPRFDWVTHFLLDSTGALAPTNLSKQRCLIIALSMLNQSISILANPISDPLRRPKNWVLSFGGRRKRVNLCIDCRERRFFRGDPLLSLVDSLALFANELPQKVVISMVCWDAPETWRVYELTTGVVKGGLSKTWTFSSRALDATQSCRNCTVWRWVASSTPLWVNWLWSDWLIRYL